MTPVQVSLRARPKTGDRNANVLTVALAGIRRMDVILQASNDVEGESNDVWWTLAAWATLVTPLGPKLTEVHLSPSQITVAPLGARTMHVATLFWPLQPAAEALHVLFSTAGDVPQALAQAWGVGDTTPHDFSGIFVSPFGYPRPFERLIDPLPDDPKLLEKLQIDGRLPPPRLLPPRPRRSPP